MRCPTFVRRELTRRQWLAAAGALALPMRSKAAPTAPVAVARCRSYGPETLSVLRRLFDQVGGLEGLVKGKSVSIKINMTGTADTRFRHFPPESSFWTHPDLVGATVHLMGLAGARRIRILESFSVGTVLLAEHMIMSGWEPNDLLGAARSVALENTGYLGYGKTYSRLWGTDGAYIFKGFDLNHSYEECDVFVSISKLKEHLTAGVTMCLKNLFGIAPPTIYGDAAGVDEPALSPRGGRAMFHSGYRSPSKSAPQEIGPQASSDGGYRVPRIVVDLVAARPIHLSIIDGIKTMTGAEGPWVEGPRGRRMHCVAPGLLVVGTNPVCTDAVGTALMGFDPMAERGTAPFEDCDSTLQLAEARGIGTRDLSRIEVIGPPLRELAYDFRAPA